MAQLEKMMRKSVLCYSYGAVNPLRFRPPPERCKPLHRVICFHSVVYGCKAGHKKILFFFGMPNS